MPGTQYFQDKQRNSLNSFVNEDAAKSFRPDTKYLLEFKETMERVRNDLEEGILKKYTVLRTRQLESIVVDKCYENPKFTVHEAEVCESFHFKNDYKVKQINSFWADHVSKHVKAYQKCYEGLHNLETVAQKDRAFADCHNDWVRDFKQNQN